MIDDEYTGPYGPYGSILARAHVGPWAHRVHMDLYIPMLCPNMSRYVPKKTERFKI